MQKEFDLWKWPKRKKKGNVVFGYGKVMQKCKVVWVIFINRLMVSSSWLCEFEVECVGVQPDVNYDNGLVMCNQLVQKCGRHEKAESSTYKWCRSFEELDFCLKDDHWSMKRGANCIVEEGILSMSQFNHPTASQSVVEEGRFEVDTELVPTEFVDNEIVSELVLKPVGTKADTQRTEEGFGSESHIEVAIGLAGHLFVSGNSFKSLLALVMLLLFLLDVWLKKRLLFLGCLAEEKVADATREWVKDPKKEVASIFLDA